MKTCTTKYVFNTGNHCTFLKFQSSYSFSCLHTIKFVTMWRQTYIYYRISTKYFTITCFCIVMSKPRNI